MHTMVHAFICDKTQLTSCTVTCEYATFKVVEHTIKLLVDCMQHWTPLIHIMSATVLRLRRRTEYIENTHFNLFYKVNSTVQETGE
jgi:hypothetical protein